MAVDVAFGFGEEFQQVFVGIPLYPRGRQDLAPAGPIFACPAVLGCSRLSTNRTAISCHEATSAKSGPNKASKLRLMGSR